MEQKAVPDAESEGEIKKRETMLETKVSPSPSPILYFGYFLLVLLIFSTLFSLIKVMSD